MGKYLTLWEVVPGTLPANRKEAGAALLMMLEEVKKDIKSGGCKEWGTFLGQSKGYSIDEHTEVEMMTSTLQTSPYVKYEVIAVASVDQAIQAVKAWIK